MTHEIFQFGSVVLPTIMPVDDLSTGVVESTLLDSVGGVFDYYGSDQRLPRRWRIPFRGIYVGETEYEVDHVGNYVVDHGGSEIVAGEDENRLRGQVDTLTAMIGKRDSLYRRRDDDLTVQWVTARLLHVQHVRTLADVAIARVELLFEATMTAWHDDDLSTTTKTCTAGASNSTTVAIAGNVTVQDAVFTFTPSATVTAVRVRCTAQGIDWTYTGSMAVGSSLVVDAGAQTVKVTGVDAYSGFALNSGHTADRWLPLAPGNNTVIVTPTGGGGTAKIERYDQWV